MCARARFVYSATALRALLYDANKRGIPHKNVTAIILRFMFIRFNDTNNLPFNQSYSILC